MIKLKQLIEIYQDKWKNTFLDQYILQNHVASISDWVYHGTPLDGLKNILFKGIYGVQHGEVAEYETFSTSLNSEVLFFFSDGNGETGLQFLINNANIVILDNILSYLVTQLPRSGLDIEIENEEEFKYFCNKFQIPICKLSKTPYLPYNYLSSLGVDGFMYDWVYKKWNNTKFPNYYNDESEIAFIGKGLKKLEQSISGIWIDGKEYDIKEKEKIKKIKNIS